jgi:hypothetical protein
MQTEQKIINRAVFPATIKRHGHIADKLHAKADEMSGT